MGRHVEHERFSKKRDEDDSDMDSDEDEDFPTLSKKEKKMAKKILSQPVKTPHIKSIAEIAKEKLRKLEQMVHPAKPDPGTKKIRNGQVLKRKESKAKPTS
ncbi:uncharacterized protein LOC122260433 [Penaeus japonicus]|uniref:uncharacterized protein LOC122260433 n=1 Tax=Penaeus japonicus TaxID=27405 RepID=UPI001C714966|nr:uncharacterized protein LOC122260433 [Penaeus japonicus]